MVTDFSVAEKDSRVKLCMLVWLLSGMSFSHFGELWPRAAPPGSLLLGWYKSHPGKDFTLYKSHLGKKFAWGSVGNRNWGRHMVGFLSCWWTCLFLFWNAVINSRGVKLKFLRDTVIVVLWFHRIHKSSCHSLKATACKKLVQVLADVLWFSYVHTS